MKKAKEEEKKPDRKYLPLLITFLVLVTVQLVFFLPYLIVQFADLYAQSPETALTLLLIQVLVFIGLTIGIYRSFVRYSTYGAK
jgi:peptidoglycan biosynthesis protein MviN/MurJ (putative lipid II flippase)